jgi:hypothetical protein
MAEADFQLPCPVKPFVPGPGVEKLTFGFLSGSPGYSVDALFEHELFDVSGGPVVPKGENSAINALEDTVVSFSIRPKDLDAGDDAGAPNGWRFVIRMNSDPDPAKWTVSVLEFRKL